MIVYLTHSISQSKILSAEGDVQPPPPQIPGATSQNTSPLLGCPSISQGDMSMPTGVAAATKKNIKKTARSSSMLDEDQPSKKKRKKDPDAPKRPKTAYILYTSNEDNRARVKAANPDADFGAMVSMSVVVLCVELFMIGYLTHCTITYVQYHRPSS